MSVKRAAGPVCLALAVAAFSGCSSDAGAVRLRPSPSRAGPRGTGPAFGPGDRHRAVPPGKGVSPSPVTPTARASNSRPRSRRSRPAARSGDPDDAAFAEQLWQGVVFYESLADPSTPRGRRSRTRATRCSRAENAPAPTAEQVERAKREVTTAQHQAAFDIPVVVNDAVLSAVAFYQFRTRQGLCRRAQAERTLPPDDAGRSSARKGSRRTSSTWR